jgi:Protein of unknown function (DUF664)
MTVQATYNFHKLILKKSITHKMKSTYQLAKHLRDVHFGGNWTCVNLKETLEGVTWQQAITRFYSLNTIATLVYHMNYYLNAVFKRVQGDLLDAKHEESFNHPGINSQEDWDALVSKTWRDAERFAKVIEQLPEDKLWELFLEEKYGNYYRNILGVIEHNHYHLGQILFIKKILLKQ